MKYPLAFVLERSMGSVKHRRYVFTLPDGDKIFFGRGGKDIWAAIVASSKFRCVDGTSACAFALDKHYLELMQLLVLNCGVDRDMMYRFVQHVYDFAWFVPDLVFCRGVCNNVLFEMQNKGYCQDVIQLTQRVLMHLYYGFIAENYYGIDGGGTSFGAPIKLNAVYEVLYGSGDVDIAGYGVGNFDKKEIHDEYVSRGIKPPRVISNAGIDFWNNRFAGYQIARQWHKWNLEHAWAACENVSHLPILPQACWTWEPDFEYIGRKQGVVA